MLSNIIILMIFAVFDSSPLSTMDKLQFLIFIFDVLLTNLCNVSMHHLMIFQNCGNLPSWICCDIYLDHPQSFSWSFSCKNWLEAML